MKFLAFRYATLALGLGCTPRQMGTSSFQHAWNHGPRDSALAAGVACELVRSLELKQRPCTVVSYRETSVEYLVRFGRLERDAAAGRNDAGIEVRLSREGRNATVHYLAVP